MEQGIQGTVTEDLNEGDDRGSRGVTRLESSFEQERDRSDIAVGERNER